MSSSRVQSAHSDLSSNPSLCGEVYIFNHGCASITENNDNVPPCSHPHKLQRRLLGIQITENWELVERIAYTAHVRYRSPGSRRYHQGKA